MSTLLDDFVRVSSALPCPICAKTDWCLVSRDGRTSICQRLPSEVPWGEAGYLHELAEAIDVPEEKLSAVGRRPSALSDDYIRDLLDCWQATDANLSPLAETLGVPTSPLRKLGVGWRGDCWTFPMRDAAGCLRGVRFRGEGGRKWSLRGGREGLFYSHPLGRVPRLFVCEGPTDCLALMGCNLAAVGRPSANGGVQDVIDFVRLRRVEEVVIVADRDEAGRAGAVRLLNALASLPRKLSILVPRHHKDARECVAAGGDRAQIFDCLAYGLNDWWERL